MNFKLFLESHYKTISIRDKAVEIFKNPDPSEIRMFIKNIIDEYKLYGRVADRYSLKIFVDDKDYYAISPQTPVLHGSVVKEVPEFKDKIWCYLDIEKNLQDAMIDWSGDYKGFREGQRKILENHPLLSKQFTIRVREY